MHTRQRRFTAEREHDERRRRHRSPSLLSMYGLLLAAAAASSMRCSSWRTASVTSDFVAGGSAHELRMNCASEKTMDAKESNASIRTCSRRAAWCALCRGRRVAALKFGSSHAHVLKCPSRLDQAWGPRSCWAWHSSRFVRGALPARSPPRAAPRFTRRRSSCARCGEQNSRSSEAS